MPEFTTPAPPAPTMLVFCPAPPAPPMTLPLLASDPIIAAFQTPAPPVPALKTPLPPFPPTIAPRLLRLAIVPSFIRRRRPRRLRSSSCRRGRRESSRRLVNVVIAPEFTTACAARAAEDTAAPCPPRTVPLLLSLVIVPAFEMPAPPAPPTVALSEPPPPPTILPLLVSLVIVPLRSIRPRRLRHAKAAGAAVSAADRPPVSQRRDRAGIRDPCPARASGEAQGRGSPAPPLIVALFTLIRSRWSGRSWSAPQCRRRNADRCSDRAFVGERRDRAVLGENALAGLPRCCLRR